MLTNVPILTLIAFTPLLGVLALMFIPRDRGKWLKVVGITATLIPLGLAFWLFISFNHYASGTQFNDQLDWISIPVNLDVQGMHPFHFIFQYHLAVDGLSLALVVITALISTMAALASIHIKKRWKTYYILFLLCETGMLGVFMAQDLLLFFIFFELTLITTFFLIGIWGYMKREKAATQFLLYTGIGSAIMLIAFMILIVTAGFSQVPDSPAGNPEYYYSSDITTITHNLADPGAYANRGQADLPFYLSGTMKWALFIMLLVAFGIKLPIFPFHTWMLKVHMEAHPSVVMLHSGIMLKMGAYGLIRFGVLFFPDEAKAWAVPLAVLGMINILYGAILAIVQKDFKLVLAYSSISHMGVILFGIAAFNQIGMEGAIFQMVSHGLISALMFLIVGSLYVRTGTTALDQLGGLAKYAPFMCGILLTGGMASLGLPLLSGFVSELMTFLGLFETMRWITAIGMIGIILAAIYVLRAVLNITFGTDKGTFEGMRDVRLIEAVPMIALVAFIVLLGVYPGVLSESLLQTISGFDQVIQGLAANIGG